DAKSLWEAIKNRFGGNKESKKMQKTILKQNYENFAASSQEGLDKTFNRFQKLISQLRIHGEVISHEDANLKLLRSLPSAWNNIALIMRNKSDVDTLSMVDLYNNVKVFESEIKGQSSSSSNSQNVAFVSSDNTSSTNETVNTAHNVSAASSKDQASTASYADDINTNDLKEMDLKWQVPMLTMRVKRRGHFARECRAPKNQENRNRDAPTINAPVDTSTTSALVVQDGIGSYVWSFQAEEELTNFALMAHTSSSSGSDSELHTCSKECLKSYNALQKQYDQQRETLNKSNLEIIDKTDLGYNGHVNESEVLNNVVDSCECDGDDNQINNRFKKSEGYHVVPSPYIGNYMTPRANLSFAGLDDFVFKSKIVKMRVFESKEVKKTVKPSLEKIEFVNARNTTVENENKAKKPRKFSQSPRVVSVAEKNRNNAVKSSTRWIWRPKGNVIDYISKDSGSYTLKRFNYVDPQGRLKDGISDEFGVKTGSEQKLILNGCMDWNETTAHHEIQVSAVGLTYYWLSKAAWMDLDSAKVKTVNKDVQIRALVDEKKIIVTEASIRCDLQLQDAEGTACLPNDTIFEELARIG
nr:hypothetical protein [Tanacetum cinerariifolium]